MEDDSLKGTVFEHVVYKYRVKPMGIDKSDEPFGFESNGLYTAALLAESNVPLSFAQSIYEMSKHS